MTQFRFITWQSLRGNPRTDSSFCVLANYKDIPKRELVIVDIPSSSSSMAFKSMPLKADCHASKRSIEHQHIEHHADSSRSKQSDAFLLLSDSLINAPLSSPLSLSSPGRYLVFVITVIPSDTIIVITCCIMYPISI